MALLTEVVALFTQHQSRRKVVVNRGSKSGSSYNMWFKSFATLIRTALFTAARRDSGRLTKC